MLRKSSAQFNLGNDFLLCTKTKIQSNIITDRTCVGITYWNKKPLDGCFIVIDGIAEFGAHGGDVSFVFQYTLSDIAERKINNQTLQFLSVSRNKKTQYVNLPDCCLIRFIVAR